MAASAVLFSREFALQVPMWHDEEQSYVSQMPRGILLDRDQDDEEGISFLRSVSGT